MAFTGSGTLVAQASVDNGNNSGVTINELNSRTFIGLEEVEIGQIIIIGLYLMAGVVVNVRQHPMIMFILLQIHFLLQIRQLPLMQIMLHLSIWTGRVLQIIPPLI